MVQKPKALGTTECFVYFHEGHSWEKHCAYLATLDIEITSALLQHLMYRASIDDDQVEAICKDPGVKEMLIVTSRAMENAVIQANRSLRYSARRRPSRELSGFEVYFDSKEYTAEEHFAKIELSVPFDLEWCSGYVAELTDAQLSLVFSDERVALIQRKCHKARFC